jgi:hypothetical protein
MTCRCCSSARRPQPVQASLWFAVALGTGIGGFEKRRCRPIRRYLFFCLRPWSFCSGRVFRSGLRPRSFCLPVCFFMAGDEPKFVFVVLISALLDYVIARAIHRATGEKTSRLLLAVGIALNLGLLAYCKYFGWFLQNLGALLADTIG